MKHKLLNPLRLLLVAICMLGLVAEGQQIEFNNIVYTLNPETKTAKVAEGQNQLYDYNLEEITIEPYVTYDGEEYTVTEIGKAAFYYFDFLKKINLPETIKKIGEAAFSYSGIETMVIPNSVEIVQQEAFFYCENLKSVKLSESMTVIPGAIFAYCSSLESIELPNAIDHFSADLGDPLEDMDQALEDAMIYADDPYSCYPGLAFFNCTNLKTVILSKNLKKIGNYAFQNCSNLAKIEIPESVTSIGYQAFSACPLTEFEIPEGLNRWYNYFFDSYKNSGNPYFKTYHQNPQPGLQFWDTNAAPLNMTLFVPKGLSGIYSNITDWSKFSRIVEATPVELEGEWRTFCAVEDLDFSGVEGLEAYVATEYQDGKVLMEPIEQVPAGTGVVLKGAPGFYEIPYPDQDEALEPVDNLLVGLNFGERIAAEDEDGQCNLFFNDATEMASLFYGPFMDDAERAPRLNADGEQPMFAPADGARLPYHRAYLQLPASEAGKTVEMVFDTLTGIEEVEAQPQIDNAIYNLQGQRVVNPGPGIYIQNGRKFIVR